MLSPLTLAAQFTLARMHTAARANGISFLSNIILECAPGRVYVGLNDDTVEHREFIVQLEALFVTAFNSRSDSPPAIA